MKAMRKFGMAVCFLTTIVLLSMSHLEFDFWSTILCTASLYFLVSWVASILDGSWLNKVDTFQRTSSIGFLVGYLLSWVLETFLQPAKNAWPIFITLVILVFLCLCNFLLFLSAIHDGEHARS